MIKKIGLCKLYHISVYIVKFFCGYLSVTSGQLSVKILWQFLVLNDGFAGWLQIF